MYMYTHTHTLPLLSNITELPAVSSSSSAGAVAGGVLAPISFLAIVGSVVFGILGYFLYKKRGTCINSYM